MHVKSFFHICADPDKPEEGEYVEYSGTYETVGELLDFEEKVHAAVVGQIRAMPAAEYGLLGGSEPIADGAGHGDAG